MMNLFRLHHRYTANHCGNVLIRKTFVKSVGRPMFDRDDAYNRVANLRVFIGTNNMENHFY